MVIESANPGGLGTKIHSVWTPIFNPLIRAFGSLQVRMVQEGCVKPLLQMLPHPDAAIQVPET